MEVFLDVHLHAFETPIIVMHGLDNEYIARQVISQGAQDYLVKGGFDSTLLIRAIHHAIERKQTEKKLKEYALHIEQAKESEEKNARRLTQMVKELKKAKLQAESAAKLKNEFLATISHEICTPLNGIVGMAEILAETNLTKVQLGYLTSIQQSADALQVLFHDILDFTQLEAGQVKLQHLPFKLKELLDRVTIFSQDKAQAKGLAIVTELADDVPLELTGDAEHLYTIISHLLDNAVKFTSKGKICLKVNLLSLPHKSSGRNHAGKKATLHFIVEDTGIGIPPARQKEIFESFTQVDGSLTRQYGGTGLGLAVASRLIGLMNGRIWVVSPLIPPPYTRTGAGTAFHFTVTLKTTKAGRK
jgi:signal transduction histidine kinase